MIRPSDILSRAEIETLRKKSEWRSIGMIVHAWAVIVGAQVLFVLWPNPLSFLFAVFVIGARQLGLAILMHDGAHGLLARRLKLNDRLSQWLCAFPVFADTRPYRPYHMTHHRRTQQADDPDLVLSRPFPITRASLFRKFLRDLTLRTAAQQRRSQIRNASGSRRRFMDKLGGPLLANAVLFAGWTLAGHAEVYPLLWLVPLGTSYMLVLRIRNIAEHAMVPDDNDDFRNARTTHANWFERAFIAPYYVNYHIEHHLFPFIPAYRLPDCHRLLLAKGYGPKMEIRQSYFDVLRLAASKA